MNYFYIRDEVLGPTIVRVASFFPFHATYWLNGHSFPERELTKAGVGFHKNDNAFLAVDDVAALQPGRSSWFVTQTDFAVICISQVWR